VCVQLVETKELAISCGRDKVVILWSLDTGEKIKIVPVSKEVEGMCLASPDNLQVCPFFVIIILTTEGENLTFQKFLHFILFC
jgi:hypothetical protein